MNSRLSAEQRARVLIDRQLADAGWAVQDRGAMNLFATRGVAVRETIMAKGHGRVDYMLYVDQKAVGAIEGKPGEQRVQASNGNRRCTPLSSQPKCG
jgi:type I restriction enzyme, R subunit